MAQIITGLTSTDAGAAVTDTFRSQLAAQEGQYVTMGVQMITWVTAGAKSATNSDLVNALIDALAPGIAEKLAGRG
jgi:hypothetical protein